MLVIEISATGYNCVRFDVHESPLFGMWSGPYRYWHRARNALASVLTTSSKNGAASLVETKERSSSVAYIREWVYHHYKLRILTSLVIDISLVRLRTELYTHNLYFLTERWTMQVGPVETSGPGCISQMFSSKEKKRPSTETLCQQWITHLTNLLTTEKDLTLICVGGRRITNEV